jgi:hypothetical protein
MSAFFSFIIRLLSAGGLIMAIAVENCGLHNRVALRIIMMVSSRIVIMTSSSIIMMVSCMIITIQ